MVNPYGSASAVLAYFCADVASLSPHISRLHRGRMGRATIALRLRCGGRCQLLSGAAASAPDGLE
eukprot:12728440-Alexandrium_andersonii.AAC.1